MWMNLLFLEYYGKHTGETYFPSFEEYNFHLEKEIQMETFVLQIYKKG